MSRALAIAALMLSLAASPLSMPFGVSLAGVALAVQPEEQLDDPALEARAREISKGLRCVVCDNQTIDESEARIAGDMRKFVRDRLVAGDTDAEIVDQMVGFYGEFVLLQPRFSLQNALIWIAPVLAIAFGLYFTWRRIGSAPRATPAEGPPLSDDGLIDGAPPPLTDAEKARLAALLGEETPPGKSR